MYLIEYELYIKYIISHYYVDIQVNIAGFWYINMTMTIPSTMAVFINTSGTIY